VGLRPGFGGAAGNICVNVYAFDPGEELIACCSCLITPDQPVNLGATRDLTVKTLTGVQPTSITIKVLATLAGTGGTGTSCTNSAATVGTATLANGAAAWSTTLHSTPGGTFATTEKPFSGATLSTGELASIGGRCASILGNGSGFGVCNSCKAGGWAPLRTRSSLRLWSKTRPGVKFLSRQDTTAGSSRCVIHASRAQTPCRTHAIRRSSITYPIHCRGRYQIRVMHKPL
jgi:hypothetical protein